MSPDAPKGKLSNTLCQAVRPGGVAIRVVEYIAAPYYDGHQEDAQEFFSQALDTDEDGQMAELFRGLDKPNIQCRKCGCTRPVRGGDPIHAFVSTNLQDRRRSSHMCPGSSGGVFGRRTHSGVF